ncbi:DUF333 domain-containing protein [bacterium]|nr:DUF333 domain-containing protein [bacterium]
MKNKKKNVAVIILIIVIAIITTSVITWFVTIKKQVPVQQKNQIDTQVNEKSCKDKSCNNSKNFCENKGGKFIIAFEFPGGSFSNTCVFNNGRYCKEFGFNKCVELKGMWQPSNSITPPSGNDN